MTFLNYVPLREFFVNLPRSLDLLGDRTRDRSPGAGRHRVWMPPRAAKVVAFGLSVALCAVGCDAPPPTSVGLENKYPPSATSPLVVYDAYWQAVSFQGAALPPGSSAPPQSTVPCSANSAYVLLAPGWDPTSATPPTSFIVMESRDGFGVDLGRTLDIPVDDSTFVGNCAVGSFLTQAQADFITQRVFPNDFATLRYDAAHCVTTAIDGGAP
jgi:hypothetical protein